MSANPDDIIIAWAMPVSPSQLGARLFAYVETKATLTTFRLVTRNLPLVACRSLPEEIKSLIAVELREMVFEQELKEWIKISKCMADACTCSFDAAGAEIFEPTVPVHWSNEEVPDEEEKYVEWELPGGSEKHQHNLRRARKQLKNTKGTSTLAKCSQIFARDFGIHPYFKVQESYMPHWSYMGDIEVEAYLTLPLQSTKVSSGPGPRMAVFSVGSILNPTTLSGPTDHQLHRFNIASKILNLRVFDTDEKEEVFEDESGIAEVSSADIDIQRVESKEGDGAESNNAEGHEVMSKTWPKLMILGCGELEAGDLDEDC